MNVAGLFSLPTDSLRDSAFAPLGSRRCSAQTDEALKQEQIRYKDATDGAWLEEREQYYKARAEKSYLQRRAELIETLFAWWSDVLRSSNDVAQRSLPRAEEETAALASRFSTAEILKRIRCIGETARSPESQYSRSSGHRSRFPHDLHRMIL